MLLKLHKKQMESSKSKLILPQTSRRRIKVQQTSPDPAREKRAALVAEAKQVPAAVVREL